MKALEKVDLSNTNFFLKWFTGLGPVDSKVKNTTFVFGYGAQLTASSLALFTQNASIGFEDNVWCLRRHAKFMVY